MININLQQVVGSTVATLFATILFISAAVGPAVVA
jgi:hypothetical protein